MWPPYHGIEVRHILQPLLLSLDLQGPFPCHIYSDLSESNLEKHFDFYFKIPDLFKTDAHILKHI